MKHTEQERIKKEVLERASNQVGSTKEIHIAGSWEYNNVLQYIERLQYLQKQPRSQLLTFAKSNNDKKEATRLKMGQLTRYWYVDQSQDDQSQDNFASAIMLDFDQPKDAPKVDLYTEVKQALESMPRVPYCIINTTSTDGVHVVIPTRSMYPAHQQPDMSHAFHTHAGIALDLDDRATGGVGKGFFDPQSRTTDLRWCVLDGDILDHSVLPVAKRTSKACVPKHTSYGLQGVIQDTMYSYHDKLSTQLKLFLELHDCENINIKPANKKLLGVVGTYKYDNVSCKAVCYANGIMVGSPWDPKKKDKAPTIVDHTTCDMRKQLVQDIASHYLTTQINHTNARWYWCDDQWTPESRFVDQITVALNIGYAHVVKKAGTGSSLTWLSRLKESRTMTVQALRAIQPTYPIKSQLRQYDVDAIWTEFGKPTKIESNTRVHVHRVRSVDAYDIKEMQSNLGYPLNGWELTRQRWPLLPAHCKTPLTAWHSDNMPDYEAQNGYIQHGWTKMRLQKHLAMLPACVIVKVPDPNNKKCRDTLKDPHKYMRELTLARQRIHAAAMRGTHVIVIVSESNKSSLTPLMLHTSKTLDAVKNHTSYAVALPDMGIAQDSKHVA